MPRDYWLQIIPIFYLYRMKLIRKVWTQAMYYFQITPHLVTAVVQTHQNLSRPSLRTTPLLNPVYIPQPPLCPANLPCQCYPWTPSTLPPRHHWFWLRPLWAGLFLQWKLFRRRRPNFCSCPWSGLRTSHLSCSCHSGTRPFYWRKPGVNSLSSVLHNGPCLLTQVGTNVVTSKTLWRS